MPTTIIRHMPGCKPCFHALISDGYDFGNTYQESGYMQADNEIRRFQQRFPEFQQAVFVIEYFEGTDAKEKGL